MSTNANTNMVKRKVYTIKLRRKVFAKDVNIPFTKTLVGRGTTPSNVYHRKLSARQKKNYMIESYKVKK